MNARAVVQPPKDKSLWLDEGLVVLTVGLGKDWTLPMRSMYMIAYS